MSNLSNKQPRMNLFNEEEQTSLDDALSIASPAESSAGQVECLGRTFESEEARRAYYLDILREKLQDPAFRQISGFPIAEDAAILALSDPPYYTACPNPFIEDFFRCYGKPFAEDKREYRREPFATDVSEGKNDPIYNGHSYHTKVPHKAIMRYILHYTEPGDLVFDGFCGTGMTGVAAQLCGDKAVVESLGYLVRDDGTILNEDGQPFSRLGVRRAILNDLSPAATFIAYNYNTPLDSAAFGKEARHILKEVEDECGWMYETLHTDGITKGRINCVVWTDVFLCSTCGSEINLWDSALDQTAKELLEEFPCWNCGAILSKRTMKDRSWITSFDKSLNEMVRQAKQIPAWIVYIVNGKRYTKKADTFDLELIRKIEDTDSKYWFPIDQLPQGHNTRQPIETNGVTHVHHFHTRRNLITLSKLLESITQSRQYRYLMYQFDSLVIRQSKLTRFLPSYFFHGGGGWVGTPLNGTLYIPSFSIEVQPFETWENRISKTAARIQKTQPNSYLITTLDASIINAPSDSIDYIFIDPPFGSNLMYSELNFQWEAWLKVFTNNKSEAIENKVQGKDLDDYRDLMLACFRAAFRVLKPGRWMTVEFSNTKAAVWNAIQSALQEAGFVVANVAALDRQQLSFKAVTTTTAVKQDLVISAYKPNGGLEERFERLADSTEGVWQFISSHLRYLPTVIVQEGELQSIVERDPRILYDRMVAYYIQHLRPVPISSREFQEGLHLRFPERDGMYFLPEQVIEYDRKRLQSKQIGQQSMFVDDERSAIFWLQDFLKERPSTYQEIQPKFLEQLRTNWKKYEARPELLSLLEENFLRYEGAGEVPPQIHSYLSSNYHELRNLAKEAPALRAKARERWYVPDPNYAEDLEKKRENHLLREFEQYRQATGRKLKIFRLEALRAGFRQAWQRADYALIVEVGRKLPDNVLQEDEKLLMWYDQSQTKQAKGGNNR